MEIGYLINNQKREREREERDCREPEILLPWQRGVTFLLSINFFTQKKPKFSLLTVFPEPV